MLTRRRDKARRVVMWAAGVVLGLSMAARVAGHWPLVWSAGRRGGIEFDSGELVVYRVERWSPGWHILRSPDDATDRFFGFFIDLPFFEGWSEVRVPIWTVGSGACVVLAVAWWIGRGRIPGAMTGRCLSCGYDLTGIDGVCPECGSLRPLDLDKAVGD